VKKKKSKNSRALALLALHKESAKNEREGEAAALPPNQRTHFLRVRLPGGGSAL